LYPDQTIPLSFESTLLTSSLSTSLVLRESLTLHANSGTHLPLLDPFYYFQTLLSLAPRHIHFLSIMQLFNLNFMVSLLMASTALALPVLQTTDQPALTHTVPPTSHLVKRAMPDWANMPNNQHYAAAVSDCAPTTELPAGAAFAYKCYCSRMPAHANLDRVKTITRYATVSGGAADNRATVQTRGKEEACHEIWEYIRVL
jgi:hypothetical protein